MNGRSTETFITFASLALAAAARLGEDWGRLYSALLLSCLLHGGLLFLPSLGASTAPSWSVTRGAPASAPARVLDVRLAPVDAPASAGTSVAGPEPSQQLVARITEADSQADTRHALGADAIPVPAPIYYTADQLTKRPEPTSAPNLYVPGDVAQAVTSGKATLKIWINALGNVDLVDVEESNVPEPVSAIAVAAFGRLVFVPGEIEGRRVGAILRIEVKFDDFSRQRR